MQLQRKTVGVKKETQLFPGVIVQADRRGFDSQRRQLPDGFLYALHPKAQVAQAAGSGFVTRLGAPGI